MNWKIPERVKEHGKENSGGNYSFARLEIAKISKPPSRDKAGIDEEMS